MSIRPLYPLIFAPIFKERIWGGRRLEHLYQKHLPPGIPVGESWEITDRPEGVSRISNGRLAGRDLRWLMETDAEVLIGNMSPASSGRFPWLVKILDARRKLSLQVHPPAASAQELSGEPKTEMWYVTEADPGAALYVGLRAGITREEFAGRIIDGTVESCFHRHDVRPGDVMFLPSGRVHAIGAGLVIYEIQQNSDTTYRVFDWNRPGLDGRPRELHREAAMASIDFDDFEPDLVRSTFAGNEPVQERILIQDPLFTIMEYKLAGTAGVKLPAEGRLAVVGVISGASAVTHEGTDYPIYPGQFCLLPAGLSTVALQAKGDTRLLMVRAPV